MLNSLVKLSCIVTSLNGMFLPGFSGPLSLSCLISSKALQGRTKASTKELGSLFKVLLPTKLHGNFFNIAEIFLHNDQPGQASKTCESWTRPGSNKHLLDWLCLLLEKLWRTYFKLSQSNWGTFLCLAVWQLLEPLLLHLAISSSLHLMRMWLWDGIPRTKTSMNQKTQLIHIHIQQVEKSPITYKHLSSKPRLRSPFLWTLSSEINVKGPKSVQMKIIMSNWMLLMLALLPQLMVCCWWGMLHSSNQYHLINIIYFPTFQPHHSNEWSLSTWWTKVGGQVLQVPEFLLPAHRILEDVPTGCIGMAHPITTECGPAQP